MELIWNILAEISDDIGEERLRKGYLLKYEGWGGFCAEEIWFKVVEEQKQKGIDTHSEEAEQEREEACYEYAEGQSYMIIEGEWKPELIERGYSFVDGGHDNGGLYGRTWALFKRSTLKKRKKN